MKYLLFFYGCNLFGVRAVVWRTKCSFRISSVNRPGLWDGFQFVLKLMSAVYYWILPSDLIAVCLLLFVLDESEDCEWKCEGNGAVQRMEFC